MVVQVNGNDQYVVKVDGTGRLTLRNRKYLRKFQPLYSARPVQLISSPQSTGISKQPQPGSLKESPTSYVKPPSNLEVISPESEPIVWSSPVEPTKNPSIPTPPQPETADSQPPSNTKTTPETRKSSRRRNPPPWHSDYVVSK